MAAEAGNMALRTLALGGVYVAGRHRSENPVESFETAPFCAHSAAEASSQQVLARVPISVVVNEDAPVWGAAYQALSSERLQAINSNETFGLTGCIGLSDTDRITYSVAFPWVE